MNPEAHEVQVAWEDGAVENVARDQLELGRRVGFLREYHASCSFSSNLRATVAFNRSVRIRRRKQIFNCRFLSLRDEQCVQLTDDGELGTRSLSARVSDINQELSGLRGAPLGRTRDVSHTVRQVAAVELRHLSLLSAFSQPPLFAAVHTRKCTRLVFLIGGSWQVA